MTKDRPFKNYKTPTERPFKTYNPVRSSMLFEDFQQQQAQQQQVQQQQLLSQQSLRLNSMSTLLQQQQQQHQQQQQQQQQGHMFSPQAQASSTTTGQQVYGDPEDFIHLNAQQTGPNPIMNIDPSINPYYDELGLDDPDNPLIRPELLVANDSLLQREQDLNIPNTSSAAAPNFIIPSTSRLGLMRGGPQSSASSASMQDSLSMLFEQPQQSTTPYSSSSSSSAASSSVSTMLQQQQLLLSSKQGGNETNGPITNNHFGMSAHSHSPSLPGNLISGGGNIPNTGIPNSSSNGRTSCPGSNGMNRSPPSFPVKQEADEGHHHLGESPSPSVQSPSQSDPSDSFMDSPKTGIKRSLSEGANSGLSDQGKQGDGGSGEGCPSKADPSRDPLYLEKRRKNNESAKRSREARRSKEELVALRVITLEEENMKLRAEISLLDKELEELRHRLFT